MLTDLPSDQTCSKDAFELAYQWVQKRLHYGRFTVMDATHTLANHRLPLIKMAKKAGAACIGVVLDMPLEIAQSANSARKRKVPQDVLKTQFHELRQGLPQIREEGFDAVLHMSSPEERDQIAFYLKPNSVDKRHWNGPFDIIGDIHGCFDELIELLQSLDYTISYLGPSLHEAYALSVKHHEGRKLLFLGDLCDRGPLNHLVLRLVMDSVDQGQAVCLLGNHEVKLQHYLEGAPVKPTHGLDRTIANLQGATPFFKKRILRFFSQCQPHLVLDGGHLIAAHAGLSEIFHGYRGPKSDRFALYGDVRKGADSFGLPIRADWAAEYRGKASVVYGHTPFKEAIWRFNTLCLDTGCVFGGKLSALRFPEGEIVSVPAHKTYFEPIKPIENIGN